LSGADKTMVRLLILGVIPAITGKNRVGIHEQEGADGVAGILIDEL
jgi:hypothetical protein